MAKQAHIAVVGSANVDLTSFTDHFPKPGETVFGDSFDLGFGGKGANQAVAAKYCGAKVQMVARVGDDLFGPATIKNFKSLKIGARHVKPVKGVASGVAPNNSASVMPWPASTAVTAVFTAALAIAASASSPLM